MLTPRMGEWRTGLRECVRCYMQRLREWERGQERVSVLPRARGGGQKTGREFGVSHTPAGEWRRRECVGGWKHGGRIGELCSLSHPELQEWGRGRNVCVSCYSQDWESGGQRQGRENGRREEKASGNPSSPLPLVLSSCPSSIIPFTNISVPLYYHV